MFLHLKKKYLMVWLNFFFEGPKCLVRGAEVFFARGQSVFSRGAEMFWRGAKVSFQKGAEGAELVGAKVSKHL